MRMGYKVPFEGYIETQDTTDARNRNDDNIWKIIAI